MRKRTVRAELERAIELEPELWRTKHALAADVNASPEVIVEHLRGMLHSGIITRRRGNEKWAEYEYRSAELS